MKDKILSALKKLREVCPNDIPLLENDPMPDHCTYCQYFIGEDNDSDAICLFDIIEVLEECLEEISDKRA